MFGGKGQQTRQCLLLARPFQHQQLVEEVLQARFILAGGEGGNQLGKGRQLDPLEQRQDGRDGTKTVHRLIGGEGKHQLGLVVGILVVAIGGLGRDAGGLLLGKARFGLRLARVYLDGEGLLGAQHLEQERQAAKTGLGGFTQYGGGGALYQGRELLRLPGQHYLGAAVGVGTHPQLGLGFARRIGDAEQGGEGVMAAPVVALNRILH